MLAFCFSNFRSYSSSSSWSQTSSSLLRTAVNSDSRRIVQVLLELGFSVNATDQARTRGGSSLQMPN